MSPPAEGMHTSKYQYDRNNIVIQCDPYINLSQPCAKYSYSRTDLLNIGDQVRNNGALQRIDHVTCLYIRRLRLTRRRVVRKRGKKGGKLMKEKKTEKKMSKLRGINVNNNIQIECDKKSVSISALKNGVQLALLNCQSIKNKDAYVKDLMDNYELDALLLTETWLQGDDVTWCLQTQLNQDGTKLDHCDRKDRPGGGISLVYRDNSKVKLIKHDILRTFEYAIWKLVSSNICFHIIGIYRPPYSEKHRWTVNHFIDEITEFLTDVLPSIKNPIIMIREVIPRAHKVRYLGIELDEQLSFSDHITTKCKKAMYGLQKIRNIRHLLTQDACHTLVLGTVISHLDYANAIFIGLPDTQIRKLQRVQNFAAKLVLQMDKYSSSTTALKTLHWLPVRLRIKHKVLTMIWKCLNGLSPLYLRSILTLSI
ncbi:hypothetical protein SNE40_007001 [Patella caerulea]|uniref:Uncharacterized protein n=1 Tax=Patella caerulea TaxID=87958 RepID=A0AAN8JWU5_PATCE